jgi:two-component system phosphate regulon sensor histidine kinase PhoR
MFVTLLSISVAAASIATVVSAYLHQSTVMAEARIELGNECDVLASTLDSADNEAAELAIIDLGAMRATLVTPTGEVLYDTLVSSGELVGHEDRPEIMAALAEGSGSSTRLSDTLGSVSLYEARLLKSGNVIRLSVQRDSVFAILAGDLRILALVLLVLVVLCWFASRMIAARLVKPILQIDPAHLDGTAPYEELQPLTERLAIQQTELISQMEELKSADAMRREFTANVTHELKTPIASIMGASELMRDGFVLEEDVPDFAARINDESQRLSALVNDILMLSKLDESHRERNLESFGAMEPVDLMAVVHDASDRMAGRADAAEVRLVVEGEPVLVEGYPRIVDELVSNLMSNAIRYNKPGGEVRVHVGLVEGRPTLEVADTGIGIPEEAQAKVFERFYRVETSRSRASGGTGLGLAIVKHAAALHEAQVTLQSELGTGTTITVSFPPFAYSAMGVDR